MSSSTGYRATSGCFMDDLEGANGSVGGGEATHDPATLAGSAPAADRITVAGIMSIETRSVTACPHCGGTVLHSWGKGQNGLRRWRCRACQRTSSATTATVLAGLHGRRKFAAVLADMMSSRPSSCRRLARNLSIGRMTAWAWRQRINAVFAASADRAFGKGSMDPGRVVLRESRKASREWVDHRRDPHAHPQPDRHRWIDYRLRRLPLPQPMTRHLVAVRLVSEPGGVRRATILRFAAAEPREGTPAEREPGAAVLVGSAGAPAVPLDPSPSASSASRATAGQMPGGSGGALAASPHDPAARLMTFLGRFRGPATKHLVGYVAWFIARLTVDYSDHLWQSSSPV